jgi:hypothetical protein
MELWFLPAVNAAFTGALAVVRLREGRLMTMYWILATYFALVILRDMWAAPIVFGQGYVPAVVDTVRISRIATFVLLCNVTFATGEYLAFRFTAGRAPYLTGMCPRANGGRILTWFYGLLFAAGCVLYLPEAYAASYYDYVNNVIDTNKKVLFTLSMPVLTLSLLRGRYGLPVAGLLAALSITVATTVREPLLVSALPLMLALLVVRIQHKSSSVLKLRMAAVLAAALIAVFGTYIGYVRTGGVELPEQGLARGMYLVFELRDGGIKGTGYASLETVAKALAFPFYNRYLIADYKFPRDPATYVADIMVVRPEVTGFRHYPFLWYTDMYLSQGRPGFWQGLVWGALLGSFEGLLAGRALASAVFLPTFTWILYIFYRGGGAAVFHSVSRQIYFHLFVLMLGSIAAHVLDPRSGRVYSRNFVRWQWSRGAGLSDASGHQRHGLPSATEY